MARYPANLPIVKRVAARPGGRVRQQRFTAASALAGMAPGLPTLIGARALQGVGAAVLGPCSLTLINHSYPQARERVRALGLWAAGASVALSAGPLIGGSVIGVALFGSLIAGRLVPGLHVALALAVTLCAAAALCARAVRAGGGNPPGEDGR
jgi:MFS family permease